MAGFLFALVTQTERVRTEQLYSMAKALEVNAIECANVWGKATPAIVVIDDVKHLPNSCHPVIFMDEHVNKDYLAVHSWDWWRQGPAASVFVAHTSGVVTGRYSACEAASHEIVEAIVNPEVNLWVDHGERPGVQMALEVADMVQDHYYIGVDGAQFPVSNFVTPAYFRKDLLDPTAAEAFLSGSTFDRLGTLKKPFAIGPEGYAILRSSLTNNRWSEYGSTYRPKPQHKGSRTSRMVPTSAPQAPTSKRRLFDW